MHIEIAVQICYVFTFKTSLVRRRSVSLPETFTSSPVFSKVAERDLKAYYCRVLYYSMVQLAFLP